MDPKQRYSRESHLLVLMCQPEAKGLCAAEQGMVFGVLSLQCDRENREHLKYLRNVTVLQEKSRANQE